MENNVLFALLITVMAGAATGLGSIISIFTKRTNTKFLAASLGFSAGVMIYVSMIEIFSKAKTYITSALGEGMGYYLVTASFFLGVILIALIDFFVPSGEGDINSLENSKNNDNLKRMGFMTALAIGIHNFPEGMVTFTAALKDPTLGIAIALAIAIHNIPEGIATSVPIYYSTGSRKKAFFISFFSGATEPLGAIIGYALLRPFFNDVLFGILFGIISGIMVFISIEDILPMAREYEKSKVTIISFIIGMAVISISLMLFI